MPGVSKHLRHSKKRVSGTSRGERKEEQRSKNQRQTRTEAGSSSVVLYRGGTSLALPGTVELAPAIAEELFGEENDVDMQNFIRSGRNVSDANYCLVDNVNSAFVCRSRNSGNKLSFVDFLLCMIIALMCMYMYVLLEQVISQELVTP